MSKSEEIKKLAELLKKLSDEEQTAVYDIVKAAQILARKRAVTRRSRSSPHELISEETP